MKHLLVTNDFPPKIGGIQNYLWELWRRLPKENFAILTRPHKPDPNAEKDFDENEPYKIYRSKQSLLLPTPKQAKEIRAIAKEVGAEFLIFDPAIPLGHLAPKLNYPYGVIFHGAEVSVPARLPILKQSLKKTIAGAELIITASQWAQEEAEKIQPQLPTCHYLPPGVDTDRFVPLESKLRKKIRGSYQIEDETFLIVCVSRLVPRKGIDILIKAVANLRNENLKLIIAGSGRDEKRLQALIEQKNAPAYLIGRISDEELSEVYGMGDLFVMPCRTRWNGLEQEGFGIVFMEAASCGLACIAGRSGGAQEAVSDGETGVILNDPTSVNELTNKIKDLMSDSKKLQIMGKAARKRAEKEFDYNLLADRLKKILKCQN